MRGHAMSVVWCDPPTRTAGRRTLWRTLLEPLLERPGEWAMVRSYLDEWRADHAYSYLTHHRDAAIPPGRWEFYTARYGTEWGLWARWLG